MIKRGVTIRELCAVAALVALTAATPAQPANGDTRLQVLDVSALVTPRAEALWIPQLGSSHWGRSAEATLRVQPAWDMADVVGVLEAALAEGGWGSVHYEIDVDEQRVFARTRDAVLQRRLGGAVDDLVAGIDFVRLRSSRLPALELGAVGRIELVTQAGTMFWAWVGRESAVIADEDLEIGPGTSGIDPQVARLTTGFTLAGVAAPAADGTVLLRDLQVQATSSELQRGVDARRARLQMSTLRCSEWSGSLRCPLEGAATVALAGAGLLESEAAVVRTDGGEVRGRPRGVPPPRMTWPAARILVADLADLVLPPAAPLRPEPTTEPGQTPWAVPELALGADADPHPLVDSELLVDRWLAAVTPEGRDGAEHAIDVEGGRLMVRGDVDVLQRAEALVAELCAELPTAIPLEVVVRAGAPGEPLETVHQGEVHVRSGSWAHSNGRRWIEYIRDLDAEIAQESAELEPITDRYPAGTLVSLRPAELADRGLQVEVFLDHAIPTREPFASSPLADGAGTIELPEAHRAMAWVVTFVPWEEPTVVVRMADSDQVVELELTATLPPPR
jgi:hypothetical protein